MIRFFKNLIVTVISLAILAAAIVIPAPIVTPRGALIFKAVLVILAVFVIISPFLRRFLPARRGSKFAVFVQWSAAIIPAAALILLLVSNGGIPLAAALPILCISVVSLGIFRAIESSVAGAGIISLALFVGVLLSSELTLRSLSPKRLLPEVAVTPPLITWKDKGEEVYTVNGFRGRRPCTDCETRPIRIFTMGGSSTFGIPMYYTVTTYAAVLERMLHTRRPSEKFEVYNAGIPGFGVFQILDALNRTILKFKPDIVTVNAGFNDGGPPPGWYTGLGSRSDFDGYRRLQFLRWVQEWPPFRIVHDSKLYGWFNMAIGRAKGKIAAQRHVPEPGDKRSSPEEFKEGLRRIAKLGHKEDFLPVFILEPVNRSAAIDEATEKNPYQRAMVEVAREEGVPLVDSLSAYNRSDGWLFYDVVHSNENAHSLMAQTIYEALFLGKSQTDWGKRFFASRGISLSAPDVKRTHRIQLQKSALEEGRLCFSASAPYRKEFTVTAAISVDGREIATAGPLDAELKSFTFKLPAGFEPDPIVDFTINPRIAGETKYGPIFHLEILSGTKEHKFHNFIKARGVRVDPNSRGVHVVVLGGKTGTVKALGGFDISGTPGSGAKLVAFLRNVKTFAEDGVLPAVAITIQGDGPGDQPELSAQLQALGGTGRVPVSEEAFAFLGRPGLKPGEALEQFGDSSARVDLGSADSSAAELAEIRDFRPCSAP